MVAGHHGSVTSAAWRPILKIVCTVKGMGIDTSHFRKTLGINTLIKYGEVTSAAWRPILKIVCNVKGMEIETSLLRYYGI